MRDLHIEGFRCFERFDVPGLTRISLLVGRNGAGKTTVLDAAQLALAGSSALWRNRLPDAAVDVLIERGEFCGTLEGEPALDLGALVHGRLQGARTGFKLRADAGPVIVVEWRSDDRTTGPVFAQADGVAHKPWRIVNPPRWTDPSPKDPDRTVRIGISGRSPRSLLPYWERADSTPREDDVLALLRVLRPDLIRITWRSSEERFMAKLRDEPELVPAGSLGEGFGRLLAFALALSEARGGALLIDEIDTGLHHSVLPTVWRLIHDAARRHDVQVLATTHSLDALRTLGDHVAAGPDRADDFSVHRIDRQLPAPVRYSGAELQRAIEAELEIRG